MNNFFINTPLGQFEVALLLSYFFYFVIFIVGLTLAFRRASDNDEISNKINNFLIKSSIFIIKLAIIFFLITLLHFLFAEPIQCMSETSNSGGSSNAILNAAKEALAASHNTGNYTTINNNISVDPTRLFTYGGSTVAGVALRKGVRTPVGKAVTFGLVTGTGILLGYTQNMINKYTNPTPTSNIINWPKSGPHCPNEGELSIFQQIINYISSDFTSRYPSLEGPLFGGHYSVLFTKYNLTMVNLHYVCILVIIASFLLVLFYFSPNYINLVRNIPVISWIVKKMVSFRVMVIVLMILTLFISFVTIYSGVNHLYQQPIPVNLGSLVDKVIVDIVNNSK